jgi:hypothetical protein
MIMNKLKMNLALIALAFPLLLCAKTQRIEMDIWHRKHRTPTELFVQIEAFFDDCNKELTIEFAQDWEAVTIEIKSKEGYVVYRNLTPRSIQQRHCKDGRIRHKLHNRSITTIRIDTTKRQ